MAQVGNLLRTIRSLETSVILGAAIFWLLVPGATAILASALCLASSPKEETARLQS